MNAQDEIAKSTDVLPLEMVVPKLAQLDTQLQQKVDVAHKAVAAELAAKHISEPLELSLRSSLRTVATGVSSYDVRNLISTSRVPPDNLLLVRAFADVEEAGVALQNERATIAKG